MWQQTVFETSGTHLSVYTQFVPETPRERRLLRLLHTRRRRWLRLRRRWTT